VIAPDQHLIDTAVEIARNSPCSKSRRGVVVFDRDRRQWVSGGFNGPPAGAPCAGTLACREICGKRCVHAEARAIRKIVARLGLENLEAYDALHVKIDAAGELAAGGGPSCWQCSRDVVDVGLGGFWLYEQPLPCPPVGLTLPPPAWRRYTAAEFHAATERACALELPRTP
jgi:deoxycytidylate deaminase